MTATAYRPWTSKVADGECPTDCGQITDQRVLAVQANARYLGQVDVTLECSRCEHTWTALWTAGDVEDVLGITIVPSATAVTAAARRDLAEVDQLIIRATGDTALQTLNKAAPLIHRVQLLLSEAS